MNETVKLMNILILHLVFLVQKNILNDAAKIVFADAIKFLEAQLDPDNAPKDLMPINDLKVLAGNMSVLNMNEKPFPHTRQQRMGTFLKMILDIHEIPKEQPFDIMLDQIALVQLAHDLILHSDANAKTKIDCHSAITEAFIRHANGYEADDICTDCMGLQTKH